jgi:tetratricopeptide (TPR) repeat protein
MTLRLRGMTAVPAMIMLAAALAPAQTDDANRVLNQSAPGVLTLVLYGPDKAEIGKGSALALAEDVVATSYHVVARASDIEGLNSRGRKVKVEGVLGVDKARGVALLKIKGKLQPLAIGNPEGLGEGALLFAVGSNESGQFSVSEASLRKMAAVGPQDKVMEMSLNVPETFSGGPLFDADGQLVGMTLFLERGIKVGLPLTTLLAIPRAGKAEEFKSRTPEEYFETFDGAAFGGFVAVALGEDMAARVHLEKAVALNASFIEGHFMLADVYARQRDFSSAVSAYRKVAELDPSRADVFHHLGSVLMRMANYKEAVPALEKAIALKTDNKEIHFELGTAYEETQEWEKAAAAYEKYLSLGPEVAWNAQLRLGISRSKLGQHDAAIAAFLEARKAQPEDLKVNFTLAEAYEKAGRFEEAEAVFDHMASINPQEAKTYHSQAIRMYDTAGLYDKAIGPARKIVDLEPGNGMNLYNLGLMHFKLQQYDEAIAAFQKCLEVQPGYAYAWFQIGSSHIQKKAYKESAEAYRKFVDLSPEEPSGWLSLGVSYMQLKNFEAALEPMRKAVELRPDNGVAVYNLAIVYINLKDNYSAKEMYNRLVGLDPGLAEKLKKHIR